MSTKPDSSSRSSAVSQRRTFRLTQPGEQARLAAVILVTTVVFALLAVGNSYAAYKGLVDAAVVTSPTPVGDDLREQTRNYIQVTSSIAIGYTLTILGISAVFVRRLVGPLVAIERHARALKSGDYSSRIGLRSGRTVFSQLALQLNDLATRLDRESSEAERASGGPAWGTPALATAAKGASDVRVG